MEVNDVSILDVWNRGLSVIISFFSSFIFEIIKDFDQRIEITLITIGLFILWIFLDGLIRKWILNISSLKENPHWRGVLLEIVNFLTMLGIFLILQFLLELLRGITDQGKISAAEKLVGLFVLMITGFGIFQTIKMLE